MPEEQRDEQQQQTRNSREKRRPDGPVHDPGRQSIGGLVQIVPLFFQKETTQPVDGLKPYTALQLEGRDIYIKEGCVRMPLADGPSVPR